MKSKKTKEIILTLSEGILSSLTDLILVFVNYGYEILTDPKIARSLPYAFYKMDQRMAKINYQTIKRAIKNAREKGWIKENLCLSEEGQRRLGEIFLEYKTPPKWDGQWYLVNFDIPETLRFKRDILRGHLQMLGFGKLQESIWISPYNFLGDVEKLVKELVLSPYVIFSISDKVGKVQSKELAETIWKVADIQSKYQQFIQDVKEKRVISPMQAIFHYQSILQKDPQLPRVLLPDDWKGEEAHKLFLTLNFLERKQKNT